MSEIWLIAYWLIILFFIWFAVATMFAAIRYSSPILLWATLGSLGYIARFASYLQCEPYPHWGPVGFGVALLAFAVTFNYGRLRRIDFRRILVFKDFRAGSE